MKEKSIKQLKKEYEDVCNEYVERFSMKQGLDFDGWVGGEVGGMASFICQYHFNMYDIVYDINTKQPKGLILSWQDDGVDAHFENPDIVWMNFYSYSKGLRYKDLIKDEK